MTTVSEEQKTEIADLTAKLLEHQENNIKLQKKVE